jgi:hypothetical protein
MASVQTQANLLQQGRRRLREDGAGIGCGHADRAAAGCGGGPFAYFVTVQ